MGLLAACGAPPDARTPDCPAWWRDFDEDGFGDDSAGSVTRCEQPDGFVGNPYDCDDLDPEINPLAEERCDPDDVDEDCNGLSDNDDDVAAGRNTQGWPDADRDGYASPHVRAICEMAPGWLPEPGRDCDDADRDVHPHGEDPLDGVDTNCDGMDGPAIYDDFETGGPDPETWKLAEGLLPDESTAIQGQVAVWLWGPVLAESEPIDTTVCDGVGWHYMAMGLFPPHSPDPIYIEYWDGALWRLLDAWTPFGDGHWTHRWGTIDDPSVLRSDFRVRIRSDYPDGGPRIDRLMVGCSVESDDDGVPDGIDCAPADPLHWFDCGRCTDEDGDGYGPGCDLGRDCDDAAATVHPSAADPPGDDLDTDCTGLDGPELFDDFDAAAEATAWHPLILASIDATDFHSPPHGLLIRNVGTAVTPPLDLSGCDDGIWWEYLGEPWMGLSGQALTISWESLAGWVPVDTWVSEAGQAGFESRGGRVADPGAARDGVHFRLQATGQTWTVDDFYVGCFVDADGDLVQDPDDCAPADPNHWSDCGKCVDLDGDHRGISCDLGDDCDDTRADVYPHNADLSTDGTDQDCDAIDGPPLVYDDFEPAGPDPSLWTFKNAHVVVIGAPPPLPPDTYLKFYGSAGILEAAPVDTSACPSVGWQVQARGVGVPANGYELTFEYWDGAAWREAGRWQPPNLQDWTFHAGWSGLPGLLRPDLRFRIRSSSATSDRYVDITDYALGCGQL